ncbi:MAG: hypothetical protein AAFU67_19425 [Bacteroidota bacterium]
MTNEVNMQLLAESDDVKELKQLIRQLITTVANQNIEIADLKARQDVPEKAITANTNNIYDMSERVRTLERYSRKTCLIFSSIETGGDVTDGLTIIA